MRFRQPCGGRDFRMSLGRHRHRLVSDPVMRDQRSGARFDRAPVDTGTADISRRRDTGPASTATMN